MDQLLRIQQIPIALDFKVNNARYAVDADPAAFRINRQDGGLKISKQPGQLYMDYTAARASMGQKTNAQLVKQFAADGKQAAYEAVGTIAQEGNLMAEYYKGGNPIAQIAAQSMQSDVEVGIGFMPSVPVSIEYRPEELELKYQADQLHFDWRTNQIDSEYSRWNIDYVVKEYPHVNIEYVGGFVYVPKSANPNYSASSSSEFNTLA